MQTDTKPMPTDSQRQRALATLDSAPYGSWWNGVTWTDEPMPAALLQKHKRRRLELEGRIVTIPCTSCKGFKLLPCSECAPYPRPAVHCHLCHGDGQEVCGDCDGMGIEEIIDEE